MAYRILLAEDEESLSEVIQLNLELEGYQVIPVTNGKSALERALNERFDLIILDVMIPLIDGFSVCEKIRLENQEVPIIFLTAKNTSSDRVQGLKLGADDYLSKPFNLEELLLRVQSLIKRGLDRARVNTETSEYSFGNNRIDFSSYTITTFRNESITLSKKEIQLLKLLIDRKGEVVSRRQILEKVWGYDIFPSTRTIDNYILAFRKYFEQNPREPEFFHSIRSVGYKFTDKLI
ncbi:MAG TPA: response regulator transcription factor [Flavobacteriales bacterium]|nr:response regulator transcription factor [Flavobacteriales bacterium]HPH81870.1 response regulator transcription factor [Flavobacteriales bacterium]